jgi:hypothetical protein
MTVIDFPADTQKVEKISPSVMRALRAVQRGEVYRESSARSSKMVGPMGIGPIQFWRLSWVKLIEDGSKSGSMTPRYRQVLTEAGKQALETGVYHG